MVQGDVRPAGRLFQPFRQPVGLWKGIGFNVDQQV